MNSAQELASSAPERPTCPHCLRPIPWSQVCSCPEARAARLARKAERERHKEKQ